MAGSLSKYFGITESESGQPLSWPGTQEGYPYRGSVHLTTREEYEQIPIVYDAKVAILELPADKEEYERIIDRCANGWYVLRHERIDYDDAKGIYHVFLQWLEQFGEEPKRKSALQPGVHKP